MKEIQREGRSEYEVVTNFRKEFKIDQTVKLEYEIVDKGSNGFFSLFGTRPIIIKFFMPEKDNGIGEFLEGLLKRMNVRYTQVKVQMNGAEYRVQVTGVQDKGFLIGREGRLLNSVQHLLYRVLLQKGLENPKVTIDVDNYRVKQQDGMMTRVEKMVQKVASGGKSITLDPMNPAERRLVHQYVEKQKGLKTVTIGEGNQKRVVILPEGEEVPDATPSTNRTRRGKRGGRSRKPRETRD